MIVSNRMTPIHKKNEFQGSPVRTCAAALALGILVAGCTSGSPSKNANSAPEELSPDQVNELRALAQSADDLGIELQILEAGGMRINRVRGISRGETIAADWDQDPARIPTFPAELNGKRINAIVATGSSATLLEPSTAIRYRVTPVGLPLVRLEDHYNRVPVNSYLGIARVFNVAGSKIFRVPVCIMNRRKPPYAEQGISAADLLVLGDDFLRSFSYVSFDRNANIIQMSAAGSYRPMFNALVATLPLSRKLSRPHVSAKIDEKLWVRALLASEWDGGLWLSRTDAESLWPGDAGAGTKKVRVGIGERVLENVPVTVGESGAFGNSKSAVLGALIFEAYRVTIDYSVFKVYLEEI
jgi:hypothetical protein